MLKKKISIILIVTMFVLSTILFIPHDKIYKVIDVNSPVEIVLDKTIFKFEDLNTFDDKFTPKNLELSRKLNISESEAFILGNLGKYWAKNLLKGRKVFLRNNSDLVYLKYSYRVKFLYSGFCIKDSNPYSKSNFDRKVSEIRRAKYKILDLRTSKIYEVEEARSRTFDDFILVRKSHIPKIIHPQGFLQKLEKENIKILFADSTTKLRPDRDCSTLICKEILNNINAAQKTIDIAIYGYSKTPMIEEALESAIKRGVKIRLVYDTDSKGENIYPNTFSIVKLLHHNKSDINSPESKSIMHNKFYIFDESVLITGSANLSHTDMSGFNSNSVVLLKSPIIAKIYKKEFEQMFAGNFHTDKIANAKQKVNLSGVDINVYFSPQDKTITNAILPLIREAKYYIYIPTFVLTEKRVTEELIRAKQRGVDVRIIIDALNASIKHSKHKELRLGGVQVKTENYAGKMHSKSMIVDDKFTIIGSMNFSYSGENKNDENVLVIKDSKIAKFYRNFFLYQWSQIDNKWLYSNVRAESPDSIGSCFDGIDNDYDGLIDSIDDACRF